MSDINILSIETSCDDTSVAIVRNGREIISNIISSQIEIHQLFGGVVPEVASRLHMENINLIIKYALDQAKLGWNQIQAVAVTKGPGLVGSLLVGVSCAKALSYALNIPLIGVNHIHGHVSANYIEHKELKPPFTALVVSGGHTYLLGVNDYLEYEIFGQTQDDAAGESFDKVACKLGLPYPGGPEIDKLSRFGCPDAIDFPRVMLNSQDFNFSFSGLKTAVMNYLNHERQHGRDIKKENVAASFQQAVMDVLVKKTADLMRYRGDEVLVLAGGVSANAQLREMMSQLAEENHYQLFFPSKTLCTDNAAMIGAAAYYYYLQGKFEDLDMLVDPHLKL